MSEKTKKYYWLKLKEDFFNDKAIKKLRKIAGGDTYTIIYLKLMLLSLRDEGKLYYEGIEDTFYDELALEIDEDPENVKVTIIYLNKMGLMEEISSTEAFLTRIPESIGSETAKAELMRKSRARQKALESENKLKIPAKTNAERQKSFRAKQYCEKQGHIPLIEDYNNRTRYGGNYYIVLRRDGGKCAICNGNDTICVHHIDGYDEDKPENNAENKLLTLCRSCHIRVHRSGLEIPSEILEQIGYFDDDNSENSNGNEIVLQPVTNRYPEIEIEKRENIKELEKESISDSDAPNPAPAPSTPKKDKPVKHKYGEYQHVLLTDEECKKLSDEYGADIYQKTITFLDEYIEMKGYKAKSHYLAIRKWVVDAVKEREQKQRQSQGRKEPVPDWMKKKNSFNNFQQRDYNYADMERELLGNVPQPTPTAGTDESIKQRAEDLQRRLLGY